MAASFEELNSLLVSTNIDHERDLQFGLDISKY